MCLPQTGILREPFQASTHTHGRSGSTSQRPSWYTPPHGPFRRFFGHRIGHTMPVECKMHCPHIRQSQIGTFARRSRTSSAFRSPDAGGVVAGGLRSSLVLFARDPASFTERPPSGYETGICLLGSTNGISTTTPLRSPHSVATTSDAPRVAYSVGTHANPMFFISLGE